jgi:prepilin-type N-terminal cleavage/methylation domain-containing protein
MEVDCFEISMIFFKKFIQIRFLADHQSSRAKPMIHILRRWSSMIECKGAHCGKGAAGFSLIELMIVIATIGVLAAIAIPQFTAYRTRSLNTSAKADLKNAATAQEAYQVNNKTYCTSVSTLTGETYGLYLSKNVTMTITAASTTGYTMRAYHSAGDVTYSLSGPGGSITP